MNKIKERRLNLLKLKSHPDLSVGGCVPFYFCPRSVMLYIIYRANDPDLSYRGGQEPIIHLEVDLHQAVTWAETSDQRWAFSVSNAGSSYFEDYCDLEDLGKVDWEAVQSQQWSAPPVKEGKQAEFLMESSFPWRLVARVGVISDIFARQVSTELQEAIHKPRVEIRRDWYY